MLKSILAVLDCSESRETVIELGLNWARPAGAVLVALGIVDQPGICAAETGGFGRGLATGELGSYTNYEDGIKQVHREIKHALQQFTERCQRAGVACDQIERFGVPREKLALEAQCCDLVLVARQSHFRFGAEQENEEMGRRLLMHTPRPVVVVPRALAGDNHTALVALDGSAQAARTLLGFQAAGLCDERKLHIVSVDPSHGESLARVERALRFLRYHGVEATPHPLESRASPADVILEELERLQAGLLVMGAYGKPAIHDLFLGSVTRRLLRESPVPLFLYH